MGAGGPGGGDGSSAAIEPPRASPLRRLFTEADLSLTKRPITRYPPASSLEVSSIIFIFSGGGGGGNPTQMEADEVGMSSSRISDDDDDDDATMSDIRAG